MNLLWKLALRNLLRNRRRSLTTGIAVVAGSVALSLLGAYLIRVERALTANTVYLNLQGHLQIHKTGGLERFSLSPQKFLIDAETDRKLNALLERHADSIEFRGRFLTGSGLLVNQSGSRPFVAMGFDRSIFKKAVTHPLVKRWARGWVQIEAQKTSDADLADRALISITPRLSQMLGLGNEVSEAPPAAREVQLLTRTFFNDVNAVDAELGIMHTTGVALAEDTSVRMSLELLQELLATEGYQYQSLFLKRESEAAEMKKALIQEMKSEGLPLEVFIYKEEKIGEFYVGTMNFLYVMGAFFIFLICGMVSLSIINSLTLGILERTKELGTMKALGFSTQQIVGLFVRETMWLTSISVVLGFTLAQLIARAVNVMDIRFTPPGIEGAIKFELAPELDFFLIVSALLLSIAILTAFFVSKSKMRSSAIDLLSDVGV